MKITKALFISATFFLSLLLTYYLHISFFKVDVVFYSSIFDVFVATMLTAIILARVSYFSTFNQFEKFQMIAIWFLCGYILAISVPTVIDRSLSFYILEKMQQRGGGIQLEKFEEVFTKEYAKEHRLVDVRLTEQLESGTITIHDGCVKLTERGHRLAVFSRFFRQNFLPKQRLLMGKYSDDLTNPFRDSGKEIDYRCQ